MLSTKLDYHSHWKKIVEDIEQEYRMLSLDFLKRTYHSFAPDKQGETPEIIWWSIFAGEQKKFLELVGTLSTDHVIACMAGKLICGQIRCAEFLCLLKMK